MGWLAYWTLEPPLADRIELAIGILASLLAEINRDSKRRPEPFSPADFMVRWSDRLEQAEQEEEPEEGTGMSPEQIIAAFDRIIEQQNRRAGRLKNGG